MSSQTQSSHRPRSSPTAGAYARAPSGGPADTRREVIRALRLLRKVVPVRDEYAGTKFFVKEAGKRVATPLLAVVVAIEAADLTLVRGDLDAAVDAIRLSRRTLGIIRGNLFWAFAYNVAALPLAAAGLLNPMIAGATMALSSVFVVANSLRLRRFRPATPVAGA